MRTMVVEERKVHQAEEQGRLRELLKVLSESINKDLVLKMQEVVRREVAGDADRTKHLIDAAVQVLLHPRTIGLERAPCDDTSCDCFTNTWILKKRLNTLCCFCTPCDYVGTMDVISTTHGLSSVIVDARAPQGSSLCGMQASVERSLPLILPGLLQNAFVTAFEQMIIPAFEKGCQNMYSQVGPAMRWALG